MKQVAGWWLPSMETHLVGWLAHPKNVGLVSDGRVMYQGTKLNAAMDLCKSFRTVVDIGAHCGTWSFYLAKRFNMVEAFEPVAEHRECFRLNVTAPNVQLHACALGETAGSISITTTHGSSGDSHIDGDGDIPMITLDSLNLQDVDCIKIDVEGAEEFVIRGALETIKRWRPMMIVEQKGHAVPHFGLGKEAAVDLLKSIGMVPLRPPMSGDWIMGWV